VCRWLRDYGRSPMACDQEFAEEWVRSKTGTAGTVASRQTWPRRLALVFYDQRQRFRARAEAEARGKSFWTPSFNESVRRRLLYAVGEAAGGNQLPILEKARWLILKRNGDPYLNRYGPDVSPAEDFAAHFMACKDDVFPAAIEALYAAMESSGTQTVNYFIPSINTRAFGDEVQQILEEERVSFDFVRGKMESLKSKELHQDVIEPAMKLLRDPRFPAAEKAYQNALEEVTKGKPGDAITDAGAALQETLIALGCGGNRLDRLIKSAKAKGMLAAHDARMTQAIEHVMDWVAADRSEKGDSHKGADAATKDDAWFIIHVVGALIVRLVGAGGR
jgi:hypothetical protein